MLMYGLDLAVIGHGLQEIGLRAVRVFLVHPAFLCALWGIVQLHRPVCLLHRALQKIGQKKTTDVRVRRKIVKKKKKQERGRHSVLGGIRHFVPSKGAE